MSKIIIMLFLAVCAMGGTILPVYAQDQPQQQALSLVSGEIVSVDLTKASIEVKHLTDSIKGTYENIMLGISPETVVSKGEAVLELSDLKAGDKVTVDFVSDEKGNAVAQSISIVVE